MQVPNADERVVVQEEEEVGARGRNPRHLKPTETISETTKDNFQIRHSNIKALKTTLRVRISKNGLRH